MKKKYSKLNTNLRDLITGASKAFLLKIIAGLAAYILNIAIARSVGVNQAGIYFLALTVITIMGTLGRFGMEGPVTRFNAANYAVKDFPSIRGGYLLVMTVSLIGSCLITLTVFNTAPWISSVIFSKEELTTPLKMLSFSIVPLALFTLHSFALQGLKRIAGSIIILNIIPSVGTLIGVLFLTPFFSLNGVIFAYIISCCVALSFGLWYWHSILKVYPKSGRTYPFNSIIKSSMPLFFSNIVNIIINWSPTLFIGLWSTATDVAIYNVANRTALLTSYILLAIDSIAAPKFSALYIKDDLVSLEQTARYAIKITVFCATPIILIFFIFPTDILNIFGPEYIVGFNILRILALAQFFNAITGPIYQMLVMTGNEKVLSLNIFLGAIVIIILNIFLTPKFGLLGAALSSGIVIIQINLTSTWLIKKKIGIMVFPLFPALQKK